MECYYNTPYNTPTLQMQWYHFRPSTVAPNGVLGSHSLKIDDSTY